MCFILKILNPLFLGLLLCRRLASISTRNLNISSSPSQSIITTKFVPEDVLKFNEITLQSSNSSLIKEIGGRTPNWRKEIFDVPVTNKIVENPLQISKIIEDALKIEKSVELPTDINRNTEKQAARLIVIRKRKMRKHKLRKLRKRMKFVWARAKQRREWKKEKKFLNSLLVQIKTAQKFSAEDYVNDLIRKATTDDIPKTYKGKKKPQWLVKELLEKDRQREIDTKYQFWEECRK